MRTLWGLQYLRAVAAVSVLLFHAAVGTGKNDALGTGGVDIFFVLSGFIMFAITADNRTGPLGFLLARLKRIVPAYWAVTGVVVGMQLCGMTERSSFSLEHLIKSLLFIPSLDVLREKVYPVLLIGWTLNYEMFFYAVVATLLLLPERVRLIVLIALFAVMMVVRAAVPDPGVVLGFYTDPIILEFAFGGICATLWRRQTLPPSRLSWPLIAVGALLMIAPQPSMLPRFIGYGVPAMMMVLGTLAIEARRPIVRHAFPALLGDASYSIYLWHLFFVAACYRLLGTGPVAFALAVIGGVVIGIASYFVIERTSMRLLNAKRAPGYGR